MNPLGVIILLALLYFVACGTRRQALIAMVVGVMYLTQGQVIEIGVHLFAIRILGIALFARVMLRREFSFANLNRIDHAVLILYCYTGVVYLLVSKGQDLSIVAGCIDAIFGYFGFRGLIREEADLRWLLRAMIALLIPYALLVGVERIRGYSAFVTMGGLTTGWMREGATRCMGSFRYAVSLGTFAATFLALYIGMFHSRADRKRACIGIALCLWLVWASNSGGSLSAALVAIVGWMFWYLRKNMQMVRWGILATLVVLSFVMKAPVWYILNRVTFGGDAWHRAYLIDVALRHMGQWWLFGMPAEKTADWFPYTVNGAADITNQYLSFGVSTGIGSLVLFVLILSRAFGQVGRAEAKVAPGARITGTLVMLWGLGVMTTVHVVGWFGVSYFDQIAVIWFLQLAALASITDRILQLPRPQVRQPIPAREPVNEYVPA